MMIETVKDLVMMHAITSGDARGIIHLKNQLGPISLTKRVVNTVPLVAFNNNQQVRKHLTEGTYKWPSLPPVPVRETGLSDNVIADFDFRRGTFINYEHDVDSISKWFAERVGGRSIRYDPSRLFPLLVTAIKLSGKLDDDVNVFDAIHENIIPLVKGDPESKFLNTLIDLTRQYPHMLSAVGDILVHCRCLPDHNDPEKFMRLVKRFTDNCRTGNVHHYCIEIIMCLASLRGGPSVEEMADMLQLDNTTLLAYLVCTGTPLKLVNSAVSEGILASEDLDGEVRTIMGPLTAGVDLREVRRKVALDVFSYKIYEKIPGIVKNSTDKVIFGYMLTELNTEMPDKYLIMMAEHISLFKGDYTWSDIKELMLSLSDRNNEIARTVYNVVAPRAKGKIPNDVFVTLGYIDYDTLVKITGGNVTRAYKLHGGSTLMGCAGNRDNMDLFSRLMNPYSDEEPMNITYNGFAFENCAALSKKRDGEWSKIEAGLKWMRTWYNKKYISD